MALHRLAREEQLLRDLGIARSRRHEPRNRALSLGQQLAPDAPSPRPDAECPQTLLRDLLFGERSQLGSVVCHTFEHVSRAGAVGLRERRPQIDAGPEPIEDEIEIVGCLDGGFEEFLRVSGRRATRESSGAETRLAAGHEAPWPPTLRATGLLRS